MLNIGQRQVPNRLSVQLKVDPGVKGDQVPGQEARRGSGCPNFQRAVAVGNVNQDAIFRQALVAINTEQDSVDATTIRSKGPNARFALSTPSSRALA